MRGCLKVFRLLTERFLLDDVLKDKEIKEHIAQCKECKRFLLELEDKRKSVSNEDDLTEYINALKKRAICEGAFTTHDGFTLRYFMEDAGSLEDIRITTVVSYKGGDIAIVDLSRNEPPENIFVDISKGNYDKVISSKGSILLSERTRRSEDWIDKAIIRHLKEKHNLIISKETAKKMRTKVNSAYPLDKENMFKIEEVERVDVVTGSLKTVSVTFKEIREAIFMPIFSVIKEDVLEKIHIK